MPAADEDGADAPPRGSVRRPRAPTITIDTSQVGDPEPTDGRIPLQNMSNTGLLPQGDQRAGLAPLHVGTDGPVPDARMSSSFESNRPPTSPHNVSSPPAAWSNSSNFLAVPSSRSRGDSFDSSDAGQSGSTYGGETYVTTPTASSDGERPKSMQESNFDILNDEDALRPDPGTEDDFEVQDNKFAFSPGQLSKLLNPKSYSAFHALGGLAGLEKGLRTNIRTGLSTGEQKLDGYVSFDEAVAAAGNDPSAFDKKADFTKPLKSVESAKSTPSSDLSFYDRLRVFNNNRLPERKTKTFLQLAWLAFTDKVLILLSIAAVISLALGIYQSVGQPSEPGQGAHVEWVEGVAIMIAIIIVVVVGALNDWQKERQFVKLSKKKDDRSIKLIRSGRTQEISVYDVLAGDVVLLEPGDMIPVDGIFIEGQNVTCDESSATGESDLIKKRPAAEVYRAMESGHSIKKMDPFILSGAKVTEGVGKFLVTATGINSTYGKTMMSLREDGEVTPLQSKLNVLAEYIAKLGGAAALLYFVVAFIEFLVRINGSESSKTPAQKGQDFLNIFIIAVSVVVVAVPEGLPLAVTLALAFATTRMLKDNNLVRLLRSCETMGNATTVCSDKTGTLTQNKMTVVSGTLGTSSRFGDQNGQNTTSRADNKAGKTTGEITSARTPGLDNFIGTVDENVKGLLSQSISVNTTAFEGEEDGQPAFIGSKTETALLNFARDYLGMGPVSIERANANVVQVVPFDSSRKCMAVVVQLDTNKYRMYVKGASEVMLDQCSTIVRDPTKGLDIVTLTSDIKKEVTQIIDNYASRSLRTIGFLYKDFKQWPPRGARKQADDPSLAVFDDILKDMTLLGIFGIQDPVRPGVPEAVRQCNRAGVFVRMVTGDNRITAQAIATECGIYIAGGVVMEGPEFRKLTRRQMDQVIPRLQVLARSSPEDKRILVKRLKELGETVAVTGDGTNDAPALKTADVGFSMGIAGTEVAKEASAIILMDDNFASIVKALMWGRAVNDAVKKFLQFQVTVNITAVIVTFISGVSSGSETSVLTAVQLLWVNLIMDTFAALALATDPPSDSILDRKPDPKSAPLISITMWKQILGQAVYQLIITFILYYRGNDLFGYSTPTELAQHRTLVFNAFVWMQIFNAFNNRRLDNKFNIFEGITRNWFFIGILCIMIGGQAIIINFGGAALAVHPLNGSQWAWSIIFGAITLPIGVIVRLIPDEFVAALIPERFTRKKPTVVIDDEEAQRYEWNPALIEIREELAFLKKVRGGRLNALRFKMTHPRELLPRSSSAGRSRSSTNTSMHSPQPEQTDRSLPRTSPSPSPERSRLRGRSRSNVAFGPATVMAGVIAGSIAGWSPLERSPIEGNFRGENAFPMTSSRPDLENSAASATPAATETDAHPDTKTSDEVMVQEQDKLDPPGPDSETGPTGDGAVEQELGSGETRP